METAQTGTWSDALSLAQDARRAWRTAGPVSAIAGTLPTRREGRGRGVRTGTLAVLAGTCGLLGALLGLAANAATGYEKWPGPLDQVRAHAWPITGVLGGALVVLAVLAVVIERRPEPAARTDPRPPGPPLVPDHFVAREQSREVVTAVCTGGGQVGITTSLRGSGGFGKTLLAKYVCGQRQVQRHFRGRVYFLTVGRDVRSRAEIAAKVGEAVTLITGDTSTPTTNPEAAGAHLHRHRPRGRAAPYPAPRPALRSPDQRTAEPGQPRPLSRHSADADPPVPGRRPTGSHTSGHPWVIAHSCRSDEGAVDQLVE
ncbi:hypothetical protein [Streptomyces sp. SA15]|uniref:hypothetical protein n=1 Tax=Streptomyces sp. SA15 TaxID=934019 RepID=UPI0015CC2EC2|nr:hypothetical protein [Streptomyces sp. SA15]